MFLVVEIKNSMKQAYHGGRYAAISCELSKLDSLDIKLLLLTKLLKSC